MMYLWLRAFALTVAIESAIAVPLLRAAEPRLSWRAAIVFCANMASHPAVWFVFPRFGASYETTTWLSETWAVAIEATFYLVSVPGAPRARLWGIALVANGASWATGIFIRATTTWIG